MPTDQLDDGSEIPGVLRLAGSPFDIGFQHGRARAAEIARNISLYTSSIAATSADEFFGPTELEQLRGMAEGAAIDVEQLVALNIALFQDAGGGGIHFALTSEANGKYDLLHGVNEDGRFPQRGQSDIRRMLFVVSPEGGIPYVTFGVAGQIGGLNGINAQGVAVTTTSLLDVDERPSSISGRLHSVLVKNILEQAADIEQAIAIYRLEPGCTAYSLCLSHAAEDRLCHIEYDYHLLKVLPWTPDVISANHRLMRTVPGEAPIVSAGRMSRLRHLLGGDQPGPVSPLKAMVTLRDRSCPQPKQDCNQSSEGTVCRNDNQASILIHPQAASLWVSNNEEAADIEGVYSHYDLRDLMPGYRGLETESSTLVAAAATGEHAVLDANELTLIDAVSEHQPGQHLLAESHLDPTSDVFLLQHQFKERPLMPLVCMVETLLEAAALLAPEGQCVAGICNVDIQNGLPFPTDHIRTGRIAAKCADYRIACQLTCDMLNRSGKTLLQDKPHLSGLVQLAASGTSLDVKTASVTAYPDPVTTEWQRCFYTENIVIYHGPVFRCLRELAVDGDTAWGHIVPLPTCRMNGRRQGSHWITNPTLLDACLYSCGSFLWLNHRGTIAIPDGIDQLRFGRMPRRNEKCLISMADRGRRDDRTYYDFSVFGDDGELLVDVQGYRNKIVAEEPPPPE